MTLISQLLDLDDLMPWPRNVRHVALCGNPKCGKTTIAEMLIDEFGGGVIIDDGEPLRKALPILTSIPEEWCYTQEGKARTFELAGTEDQVRKGLGELGDWLEARYGEEVLAHLAMMNAARNHPDALFYIYPSVRKTQGRAYKRAGGVVIEIDNPTAPPSGNKFDLYDRSVIDFTIHNDPSEMTLGELREYVQRIPNLIASLDPTVS